MTQTLQTPMQSAEAAVKAASLMSVPAEHELYMEKRAEGVASTVATGIADSKAQQVADTKSADAVKAAEDIIRQKSEEAGEKSSGLSGHSGIQGASGSGEDKFHAIMQTLMQDPEIKANLTKARELASKASTGPENLGPDKSGVMNLGPSGNGPQRPPHEPSGPTDEQALAMARPKQRGMALGG
jgi:hypothetical protein